MSTEMLVVPVVFVGLAGGAGQTLTLRKVADRMCGRSLSVAGGLILLTFPRLIMIGLAVLSFRGGVFLGLALLFAYWLGHSGTLLLACGWRLKDHAP